MEGDGLSGAVFRCIQEMDIDNRMSVSVTRMLVSEFITFANTWFICVLCEMFLEVTRRFWMAFGLVIDEDDLISILLQLSSFTAVK